MANLRVNKITTGVGSYNGSIYATGTSSYLFTTVTAPGTDDFTIECYINTDQASGSNQDGIFAINGSTGGFQSTTTNQIRFTLGRAGGGGQNGGLEVNINGTAVDCGSNDIIQEGTWHHVAVTRASGTVKIWVDGVEKGSGTAAGDVTGTTFITGYYDGLYTFQGFMSNFRYRKGTAHYTTTFTAPTKPLERTSDTELIFAQSPHNPSDGFSSAIHGGTTDIMQVIGNVTANASSPTQLSDTSAVGVVYDGPIKHNTQGYMYFPTGRTEERGRGRGLVAGGSSPTNNNRIEFFTIQSQGNSAEFGDLAVAGQNAGASSSTRALFGMGGQASPGGKQNVIQFVEIATQGNAVDFGDRTIAKNGPGGLANQTRAVFAGGGAPVPQSDVMDFVTIASLGNATDFGNMTSGNKNPACTASSTRGIIVHGGDPLTNVIDFITIATAGNAQDFGDATVSAEGLVASSSPTRGIIGGGLVSPAQINNIMFITIATTGDATNFGDLTQARQEAGGISNSIRACFASGGVPSAYNTIDFVTIATRGDALDFGDTATSFGYRGGASDSHGGLS